MRLVGDEGDQVAGGFQAPARVLAGVDDLPLRQVEDLQHLIGRVAVAVQVFVSLLRLVHRRREEGRREGRAGRALEAGIDDLMGSDVHQHPHRVRGVAVAVEVLVSLGGLGRQDGDPVAGHLD